MARRDPAEWPQKIFDLTQLVESQNTTNFQTFVRVRNVKNKAMILNGEIIKTSTMAPVKFLRQKNISNVEKSFWLLHRNWISLSEILM